MVVMWLFYKRPEPTKKALGTVLMIVFGVLLVAAIIMSLGQEQQERAWRAKQVELAKVVIKANYDAEKCKDDKPLYVFIGNTSSKTVRATR